MNLETLSQQAGVSIATVSRALTGKPGVSDKRRSEIRELARKEEYRPDQSAQALRSKTRVGWMLLTSSSPTEIVQHRNQVLVQTVRKSSFSLQVITTSPKERPETTLDQIWYRPPAVLLVHGIHRKHLQALEAKGRDPATVVVILDGASRVFDGVSLNRTEGTRLATRLMLTGGAKHPVFFTPPHHLSSPDDRNRGIYQAYQELGLSPPQDLFFPISKTHAQAGFDAVHELLEDRVVDAIFTYSDQVAYGVLRALYEKNIQVPHEIRVMGFDDLPHSSMTTPSLSTIAQPVQEMIDAAIQLVEDRKANPESPVRTLSLSTKLIPRETCPLLNQHHREQTFLHPSPGKNDE